MITVDTTGARRMLKALTKASQIGQLSDTEWRQALKNGGYELFFARHNITPDQFGAMIRSIIENDHTPATYAAPHENAAQACVTRMRQAFESALQRLPHLQRDLEQLSKNDWSDNALLRAAEWLPEDARIEATIYIVLGGTGNCSSYGTSNGSGYGNGYGNGYGYIDHNNQITVDLLQYSGDPASLEKPVAHELHRIGYRSLCDPELLGGTNPESLAFCLAAIFLAEGCATAFVSGLPGPQDPDYAAWQDHTTRLPEYFALTRDYLDRIAAGNITEAHFASDIPRLYLQKGQSVARVMGVAMVQAIWKAFSKGGIFHSLRNTALFFEIYRHAVEQLRAEGIGEGLHDL